MIDVDGVLNDVRKLANISYEQGYLNGQKHDSCMLEQIKDLIRESDKNHAYTLSYPAYVFITKLKKIVGWQLEDYEERQTENNAWKKHIYEEVCLLANDEECSVDEIAEVLEQMRKESK